MAMTQENKEKCAALFEAFTDIETEPQRWNEKAGDLLAEMVNQIKDCSHGMGLARAVWPSTLKVTWMWVVKIPYHVIRNEIKMHLGSVNTACMTTGLAQYRDAIQWELIK